MLKSFDRYVLREILPAFGIGLLLTVFVLLMNEILNLATLFIDKGIPPGLALKLLALLVPSILAFGVPMAVLAGTLGALARLSTDSEAIAFQTLGIGRGRFLRPFLLFALAGWLATSGLAMVAAPRANFLWVKTMTNSVLARVQLRIAPLEFNQSIPGTVLFIRNINRDNSWDNIFAYLAGKSEGPRLIMAQKGRLHFYPEQKRATLELLDGSVHSGPLERPGTYAVTVFDRLEEEVDVANLFPSLMSEKRVREKEIGELIRDVKPLAAGLSEGGPAGTGVGAAAKAGGSGRTLRDYRAHWIEIHKKFALPFVCFLFVLTGFPLGLMTGRGGRTTGFSLSLGIILLYYVMITAGEKLAMDGRLSPWLGMWGPDLVLACAGLGLFLASRSGARTRPAPLRHGPRLAPAVPVRRRLRRRSLPFLRFPSSLDRYVAGKYLTVMGLVFGGLMAASVIVTFFERLDEVHAHGKPVGLLLNYIWFKVPEFVSSVLPVAALMAALLSLGLMAKANEVTAAKASGISLYRLVVPVLLLGAAASGAAFLIQERVSPSANVKAERFWARIEDLPPRSYSYLNRHWLLGAAKDRIYHYDYFDARSSTFGHLQVFDFDPRRWTLTRRVYADKAVLEEERFRITRGWSRSLAGGEEPPGAFAEGWSLPMTDGRGYFLRESREPAQMTYGELKAYASEVRGMGFEATRLRVDLGGRAAFPLVSLIMTILAVPFAFTMGRKGTLSGAGLSIAIAMAYWGTLSVFRSLGYTGVLTPFLAAWGADVVFGLAGTILFLRLRT